MAGGAAPGRAAAMRRNQSGEGKRHVQRIGDLPIVFGNDVCKMRGNASRPAQKNPRCTGGQNGHF
jgi:hypothetical protein